MRSGLAALVARYRSTPFVGSGSDQALRRTAIVAAFQSMRLLLDPTDRCLPLSFAMAFEMKRSGCRCNVIFGITLEPFRAHCWTQFEDRVLNDRLDHVLDFKPILVL
ncbi:lasso peptide biosynthesis B2 protein [Novosphingobium sp. KA1]|uniref:lasso peptide biosynthesis B2 protein n=1 Tax=Novosphingobium sp. (strain KA1) TaxID=164608 RepID=UPI00351C0567